MSRVVEIEQKGRRKGFVIAISILILLCVSIIIVLPFALIKSKVGHDMLYHCTAIYSLRQALDNGSFGSRVYEFISMDYGYGTGFFYTMIPSGIAAIFMKIFGTNAIIAITLEIGLLFFISGIICYFFFRRITQRQWMPLILSIIYLCFPYVIANFYTRFALSETFLTPLIPLIAWALYEFVYTKKYGLFSALFITGFSLSIMLHLSLTVYIAGLSIVFILFNFKKCINKKSIVVLLLSGVMVLLFSSIFTIPMFLNYGEVTLANMAAHGKKLYSTTYDAVDFNHNFFVVAPTIILYICYVVYLILFIKQKRQGENKNLGTLITISVLVFLYSPLCVFWLAAGFPPFNMIQFTWRLLLPGSLASTFMVKEVFEYYLQKVEKTQIKKFIFAVSSGFLVTLAMVFNFFVIFLHRPSVEINFDNRYTMLPSMWGCGGELGDYMPKGATIDSVSHRIGEEIIKESNVEVLEFADFQSLLYIGFTVPESKDGYVILKIPYESCSDIKIYQKLVGTPFTLTELEETYFEENEDKFLKINFNDSEGRFKIYIDYQNSEAFTKYLRENPFEFKVKNKSAKVAFKNFYKENSHTYTVDIETEDMVVVELPTLYYKGYKVSLKTKTGTKELTVTHGENGFLEVNVPESGTIVVEFEGSYVRQSEIISISAVSVSVVMVIILAVLDKKSQNLTKKCKK